MIFRFVVQLIFFIRNKKNSTIFEIRDSTVTPDEIFVIIKNVENPSRKKFYLKIFLQNQGFSEREGYKKCHPSLLWSKYNLD